MTLRDLPSAYRLRREGRLPKFGSGGDPFAAKEPSGLDETKAAAAAAMVAPAPVTATPRKSIWPWKARVTDERSEAERGPISKPGNRTAGHARVAVQGELSLDTVKVVRNDLHGSDVDLVSSAQVVEKPYHRQMASNLISGANAAEQALDRLAARIVGAGTR
jgi:hypothetical protein